MHPFGRIFGWSGYSRHYFTVTDSLRELSWRSLSLGCLLLLFHSVGGETPGISPFPSYEYESLAVKCDIAYRSRVKSEDAGTTAVSDVGNDR